MLGELRGSVLSRFAQKHHLNSGVQIMGGVKDLITCEQRQRYIQQQKIKAIARTTAQALNGSLAIGYGSYTIAC